MRTKMKAGGSKTAGDCKNNSKNRCGVYPDCHPCTSQKIAAGIFAGGLSAMAGTKVAQRLKGIKDEKDKAKKEGKTITRKQAKTSYLNKLKSAPKPSLETQKRGGMVRSKRK
jgi:hypothetical protein